jgi:hypothetical protein
MTMRLALFLPSAALVFVAACAGGDSRVAPSALLPSGPTATGGGFVDPAAARIGTMAVSLPSAEDALIFRQVLEAKLRAIGRPIQTTHVNPEGAIVWTLEYLRYRTNGCSQNEAIDRVFAQIDRQGVPPVCASVSGTPVFPPQVESLAFRQALEVKYRDQLGAPPLQTHIDLQSDVVYTLEFVRYSQSGCSSAQSYERVFVQIDGRGVEPDCDSQASPSSCTFSLTPMPQRVPAGGGSFTATVTAAPDTCRWQIVADVPWITGVARAAIGTQGFTYTVAANSSPQSRTGRISLRGDDEGIAVMDVDQAASTIPPPPVPPPSPPPPAPPPGPPGPSPCTYAVTPSSINADGAGGTFDIRVATSPGCPWTATTPGGFIQVTAVSGAIDGSGVARINVLRNTGGPRTGTAAITWPTGQVTVTVFQDAGPPVAVIQASTSCDVGARCQFDGSQSEGVITQWMWNFGDSGTGTGPTTGPLVDHTYDFMWFSSFSQSTLPVVVTLTVVGPFGSDSARLTILLQLPP